MGKVAEYCFPVLNRRILAETVTEKKIENTTSCINVEEVEQ